MHWNSVLTTPGAKYCAIDLKDFFLQDSLNSEYEYLQIPISLIPISFEEAHNLINLVADDGFVCAEVHGSMHGLIQAGMLAHKDLVARLTKHGYHLTTFIPRL